MGTETAAARTEIAARFRHLEVRNHHRMRFDRDIDEPRHLPRLLAGVADLLVDDHHDVALGAERVFGKFGNRHF